MELAGLSHRPRVLQVLYSYRIGGSEIFGLDLAKQLAALDVDVFCGALDESPGPMLERCGEHGIRPIELAISWGNILARNGISPSLVRRLRALRLDAIHLQHFLSLNKLGLAARLAGIGRVIVTEHSVLDVSQTWSGRMRARLNWRLADCITVVHAGIKEYLCRELRVPESRVEVIPIGIDVHEYHRQDRNVVRTRLGIQDELVFVYVGRLAPVKNVPGLIEAFLEVASLRPCRLVVVGDGVERRECDNLARKHPLGRMVILVGEQAVPRPYLAAADVFVMNSLSEGTPRALLEAMAGGLPAICPAIGGIPEIIGNRGWLTVPGSRPSLVDAMESALSDRERNALLGDASRNFVRDNFGSDHVGQQYAKLLLPAAGGGREVD